MTSPKTLPLVAHIPLLTGRADFGAWNDGIRTLILHLGYLGHISDPPPSGLNPLTDHVSTYMPILSATSTADEHTAYRFWWECDNIVSHVLLTCLNTVTRSLLPYDDGDPTSPSCARLIYNTLCKAYHIRGFTSGSALYAELWSLSCGSRVQKFVTKWCAGVSKLCAAHYPLIIHEVIKAFLIELPASVPFQMLHRETMRQIDSVHNDDIMAFIRVTNETLDIDSHYQSTITTATLQLINYLILSIILAPHHLPHHLLSPQLLPYLRLP
jgi:hypothetical protein